MLAKQQALNKYIGYINFSIIKAGKKISLKQPFSYISINEALNRISKADIKLLNSELVKTQEALGRTLAKDIASHLRVPNDDLAHFDGYAIRSTDTDNADVSPIQFKVKGKIFPGEPAKSSIEKNEAYYITTGSILPNGADAVLAIEMAKVVLDNKIQVRTKINPGEHVIRAGTDVEKGDVVIPKGKSLRSKDIAFMKKLNIDDLEVFKKPIVSILSIGDELMDKNSVHSFLLSRWIQHYGAIPLEDGVVGDDIVEIKDRIQKSLIKADIILTIGGCSMGEKDLVADAIESIGKPGMIFHGIKIRPGRVSGFGILNDKPIIMLPGLIQSTIIGFYFLFLPLLQKLRWLPLKSAWENAQAKLADRLEFKKFIPFKKAIFVKLEKTSEGLLARPILGNSSFFSSVEWANGMIIVQENEKHIEKDEIVEIYKLPEE